MGGLTADLKEVTAKLLPSRPSSPPLPGGGLTGGGLPGKVPPASKALRPPTPPFGGAWGGPVPCDVSVLKKRGHGLRTWMVIDSWGHCKMMEADKSTIMRRCELPARDLRLLDPMFVYPSTILGREKAIVVNLESIRCVITADECLLLHSNEPVVQNYKRELERRMLTIHLKAAVDLRKFSGRLTGNFLEAADLAGYPHSTLHRNPAEHDLFVGGGGGEGEDLPFEFQALEIALEITCSTLDRQANTLGAEAYPLLEQLAYDISTRNLELVRRLKSNLVAVTRRVQKVRDEIEQLMDDDGDMAEMYLTDKRRKVEGGTSHRQQEGGLYPPAAPAAGASVGGGGGGECPVGMGGGGRGALSAPASPCGSPQKEGGGSLHGGRRELERSMSWRSHGGSSLGTRDTRDEESVEELEMLLEAYFVVIDGTLNKLSQLSQYIDDTEDFINIQLDNVRNKLIRFELLLTTATFVVAMCGVVAGVFGMNVPLLGLEEDPVALWWILVCSGLGGLAVFGGFVMYYRYKNLNIL